MPTTYIKYSRKPLTEEQLQEMIALHKSGMGQEAIARHLKCGRWKVQNALASAGLAAPLSSSKQTPKKQAKYFQTEGRCWITGLKVDRSKLNYTRKEQKAKP